jgi:serine/threonine-protein kinase
VLAALHQNLVVVHDFDTEDGVDFLVMELVEGPTLSELLEGGGIPEDRIRDLGAQLAKGLAAAHEAGVIHRDIKPGNVKVTPDGVLKILDFGLAKAAHTDDTRSTMTITGTGHIVGTVPYMAPELLRGKPATPQSDIYSVGIVLYEMATGRRPHEATKRSSLVEEILTRVPLPPRKWNAQLSRLEAIIVKAIDRATRHISRRQTCRPTSAAGGCLGADRPGTLLRVALSRSGRSYSVVVSISWGRSAPR